MVVTYIKGFLFLLLGIPVKTRVNAKYTRTLQSVKV